MGKSGGTARATSSTRMPEFQMPYITNLLSEADRLYRQPGPFYFPGSTIADFAPAENLARQYLQDFASNRSSQMAEAAEEAGKRVLGGEFLDVANNPYVQDVISRSIRPAVEELTREVLPSIRSSFINTGGFGGSKQGIAEGMAIQGAQQAVGDAASRMNLGAYSQGLQSLLSGMSLAPSIQNMGMLPADILQAVGAQERAMEQARIDEAIARHQWNQSLPFIKLAEYGNIVRSPLGGYSESTTNAPETGKAEQIAGAASLLYPLIISLIRGR